MVLSFSRSALEGLILSITRVNRISDLSDRQGAILVRRVRQRESVSSTWGESWSCLERGLPGIGGTMKQANQSNKVTSESDRGRRMRIRIILVGKVRERYLREGIDEYLKRLKPYAKVELVDAGRERA